MKHLDMLPVNVFLMILDLKQPFQFNLQALFYKRCEQISNFRDSSHVEQKLTSFNRILKNFWRGRSKLLQFPVCEVSYLHTGF